MSMVNVFKYEKIDSPSLKFSEIEKVPIQKTEVVAKHNILDPKEVWKAKQIDTLEIFNPFQQVEHIMDILNLKQIRCSEYDPVKKIWIKDFMYKKGKQIKINEEYEFNINIVQKDGFIPMLDGMGLWQNSYRHYIDLILPGITYSVYESGNSFHVYWHCLENIDNYFNFFSSIILAVTPLNEFKPIVDLRWLAYNLTDSKGGLRFTANNHEAKKNLKAPTLIFRSDVVKNIDFGTLNGHIIPKDF